MIKRCVKSAGLAMATAVLFSTAASAASILYRVDAAISTDYMAGALGASSHSVTTTNGAVSGFTLTDYDAVVYANQNNSVPSGDIAALNAYVAGGGRVIFADWTRSDTFLGGQTYGGGNNQTVLTVGSQFDFGITNPLSVVNPGWGIFATGMSLSGGVSGGLFGNGSQAIVVGNGGRTIVNGFLTDTVASQQLYTNQLNFLFGATAVPEPGTWAMMLIGFGAAGAALRRRKVAAGTLATA